MNSITGEDFHLCNFPVVRDRSLSIADCHMFVAICLVSLMKVPTQTFEGSLQSTYLELSVYAKCSLLVTVFESVMSTFYYYF